MVNHSDAVRERRRSRKAAEKAEIGKVAAWDRLLEDAAGSHCVIKTQRNFALSPDLDPDLPIVTIYKQTANTCHVLEGTRITFCWDTSHLNLLISYNKRNILSILVSKNKDVVPVNTNPDLVEHNPAYNISAALTYTAQLINVLAFYFNVRLPYRMVYSDFCGSYMDEAQFTRRVARLNANVLYLCFSQNIDLSYLKSCETVHNLLRLIDTSNPHLGRQGPFEVDGHKAESLEKPLTRDLEFSGDNTDSDEGDSFHREWETVPHIPCPDVSTVTPPVQSAQMITTQQATSMAGGLVTSAAQSLASMWRGFTGR
nr:PREDICTED: beclin 1-associated autophagy-related key regulator [Tribolium castaneum]|eukprot:XP_015838946.1 PREDICTED: beclin 1-associated autophagy-related key regulator [Tribolium castaneum]